jgi:hypothetical protein
MHFGTKSYLKSIRNHTAKHSTSHENGQDKFSIAFNFNNLKIAVFFFRLQG